MRRRDKTTVQQTSCNWRVRISWKRHNQNDEKAFVLTVGSIIHKGHSLCDDPLAVYSCHPSQSEEFEQIKRMAIIPYSASRRVLETEEFGLNLAPKAIL